jgi:hypothetical protein
MPGKKLQLVGKVFKPDPAESTGIIPIFLGFNDYLSGKDLELTLLAAKKILKTVYIVLLKTPQTITLSIKHKSKTPKEIEILLEEDENKWRIDNKSITENFKGFAVILSWEQTIYLQNNNLPDQTIYINSEQRINDLYLYS